MGSPHGREDAQAAIEVGDLDHRSA